jgi:hypothetical protein
MTTLAPTQPGVHATVQLQSGTELDAEASADGSSWSIHDDRAGGAAAAIDPTQIRSYTTVSRGRGVLQGLGVGLVAGATTGVVVGFVNGDDPCVKSHSCFLGFTAEAKAVIGGIALGAVGLVAGGLFGLIAGSHDVYELGPVDALRITPMVGPGQAGATLSWSF